MNDGTASRLEKRFVWSGDEEPLQMFDFKKLRLV